jgi:hypothetical protein
MRSIPLRWAALRDQALRHEAEIDVIIFPATTTTLLSFASSLPCIIRPIFRAAKCVSNKVLDAEMGGIRRERTSRYGQCSSTYGEEPGSRNLLNGKSYKSRCLFHNVESNRGFDNQEEQNLEVRISYFYETVRESASISSVPLLIYQTEPERYRKSTTRRLWIAAPCGCPYAGEKVETIEWLSEDCGRRVLFSS